MIKIEDILALKKETEDAEDKFNNMVSEFILERIPSLKYTNYSEKELYADDVLDKDMLLAVSHSYEINTGEVYYNRYENYLTFSMEKAKGSFLNLDYENLIFSSLFPNRGIYDFEYTLYCRIPELAFQDAEIIIRGYWFDAVFSKGKLIGRESLPFEEIMKAGFKISNNLKVINDCLNCL